MKKYSNILIFLLIILATMVAIFVAPYHVPMSKIASDSYNLGFNNKVSVAAALLAVLILFIYFKHVFNAPSRVPRIAEASESGRVSPNLIL